MKHTIHIKSKFTCLLLLLTSCALFIACQSKPNTIESDNTAQNPAAEPTTTQESIPPTMTTMPTATTIPATLTPTPQPTLTHAEKEAIVTELYKTNEGCELPCWWGIIPGETDWLITESFLSTIGPNMYFYGKESVGDTDFVVEIDVPVPEDLSEISNLRHTFTVRDGIIIAIELERPRGNRKILTISDILNNYGPPTEVWLDTLGENYGDNYFPFRVALFYPLQGFLIRYFDEAELTDGYVTGCPQEISGKLSLWSPKRELTFTETLSGQEGVQYYKRLEAATEIDVETFYQIYLDPDTETCIETPAELWQDR